MRHREGASVRNVQRPVHLSSRSHAPRKGSRKCQLYWASSTGGDEERPLGTSKNRLPGATPRELTPPTSRRSRTLGDVWGHTASRRAHRRVRSTEPVKYSRSSQIASSLITFPRRNVGCFSHLRANICCSTMQILWRRGIHSRSRRPANVSASSQMTSTEACSFI